jgi:hypothetical protein
MDATHLLYLLARACRHRAFPDTQRVKEVRGVAIDAQAGERVAD